MLSCAMTRALQRHCAAAALHGGRLPNELPTAPSAVRGRREHDGRLDSSPPTRAHGTIAQSRRRHL